MSHPTKNLIFCSLDQNVFREAKIFIKSLDNNFPDHPPVYVYQLGLSASQVAWLESFKDVYCKNLEPEHFKDFPLMERYTGKTTPVTVYSRLGIWNELHLEFDNVLYLDVDTIVMGSLSELFEKDQFFCVRDTMSRSTPLLKKQDQEEVKRLLREDNIVIGETGNTGMMVIPKSVRTKSQYNLLLKLGDRYKEYFLYQDQSLINLWMAKNGLVAAQDTRYNFQVRDIRYGTDLRKEKLIHFNVPLGSARSFAMWVAYWCFRLPLGAKVYPRFYCLLQAYWPGIRKWVGN